MTALPLITIVVAMDCNRLIGAGAGLPWRLPADLRRFKTLTMGKPVIMGRRTHESIGKVLPGRRNVVLSRDPGYRSAGSDVVADFEAALALCEDAEELMVIGGAQLYAQVLPRTHRMHLTLLHAAFEGDTWFPEYDEAEWREVYREDYGSDADSPCAFSFVGLER